GPGKNTCEPNHPFAHGFVAYVEKLLNYDIGRTEGCLGMPQHIASTVMNIAKNRPMSIYVYPQRQDIAGMATANKPYWNTTCAAEIGTPRYYTEGETDGTILST